MLVAKPSFETTEAESLASRGERLARRREAVEKHSHSAAWFLARGDKRLATYEIASVMASADCGGAWIHWWMAFVSHQQSCDLHLSHEPEICSGGITARWCAVHGTCTCPRDDEGGWTRTHAPLGFPSETVHDPACPLHGIDSGHGPERDDDNRCVMECAGGCGQHEHVAVYMCTACEAHRYPTLSPRSHWLRRASEE